MRRCGTDRRRDRSRTVELQPIRATRACHFRGPFFVVALAVVLGAARYGVAFEHPPPPRGDDGHDYKVVFSHWPEVPPGTLPEVKVGHLATFKIYTTRDGKPFPIASSEFNIRIDGSGEAAYGFLGDFRNGTLLGEYVLWNSPGLESTITVRASLHENEFPGLPAKVVRPPEQYQGEIVMRFDTDGNEIIEPGGEDATGGECSRESGGLTIVTCTSGGEDYMARLRNLVGSLHVWESDTPIVVYGVAVTEAEREEILTWSNVKFRPIRPRGKGWGSPATIPKHRRAIVSSYVFKPWLMHDALEEFPPCVLYLDAGVEVRAPLDPIRRAISTQGYFFVTNANRALAAQYTPEPFVGRFGFTRQQLASGTGTAREGRSDAEIASGQIGIKAGGQAHLTLVEDWYRCALDRACFAPSSEYTRENFRQDQSVLNVMRYITAGNRPCRSSDGPCDPPAYVWRQDQFQFRPTTNYRFWGYHPTSRGLLPPSELERGPKVHTYVRRNFDSGYARHLRFRGPGQSSGSVDHRDKKKTKKKTRNQEPQA